MNYIEWIYRITKEYLFTLSALCALMVAIFLYQVFTHGAQILQILGWFGALFRIPWRGRGYTPGGVGREIHGDRAKASWELKKENVAVYAIQGRRPHMEDRFNVVTDLDHTGTSIYGVFDGHGGEFAADFVEKTLFKTIMIRLLKSSLSGEQSGLTAILSEEILNVDKQLLMIEKLTHDVSGSTALVALLRDHQLTVANVGDSRGVLCDKDGKAIPLSFDHKPQQLKERKRIKKAGGFISFNGVWRVAGILATSRALGDFPLKEKNFVIAEPDVLTFDLNDLEPKFMILASDGLWDTFSNEEAVSFINERLEEPHFGAKSLVLQAYYRGSEVTMSNGPLEEATTPRGADRTPVYVFIRVQKSYLQESRNSLISMTSIRRNYGGSVVGFSDQCYCFEGDWPDNRTLIVLQFRNMFRARQWYDCTPDVKQPDWLGGVDIIAAPLSNNHNPGKEWMSVVDIEITDREKFYEKYLPSAATALRKVDGAGDVMRAGPRDHQSFRGNWQPRMLVAHLWDSDAQFDSFINSPEYQKVKSIRQATSNSMGVLVHLGPLKREPDYTFDVEAARIQRKHFNMY